MYTLISLILMALFVIGCLWCSRSSKKEEVLSQDRIQPVETVDPNEIGSLENELICEYFYREDWLCSIPEGKTELRSLIENLMKMDKSNPKRRTLNEYDKWFVEHVEDFYKYGETMTFMQYFGYLCDTFLDNLKEPEKNLELQKRLISIYDVGCGWGRLNFSNVLCLYLERWDLLPEVKKIVFEDERFKGVKNFYERCRRRK